MMCVVPCLVIPMMLVRGLHPHSHKGMSPSIIVDVALGPDVNPAYTIPCNTVISYIDHLQKGDLDPTQLSAVWGAIYKHVCNPSKRWKLTTGPLSATQSVMFDLGWTPRRPAFWRDGDLDAWILDT